MKSKLRLHLQTEEQVLSHILVFSVVDSSDHSCFGFDSSETSHRPFFVTCRHREPADLERRKPRRKGANPMPMYDLIDLCVSSKGVMKRVAVGPLSTGSCTASTNKVQPLGGFNAPQEWDCSHLAVTSWSDAHRTGRQCDYIVILVPCLSINAQFQT